MSQSYQKWVKQLAAGESITRKASGNSMAPRISKGQEYTIDPITDHSTLNPGDAVFCKVRGNFYIHKIEQMWFNKERNRWEFVIANQAGHVNGKTHQGRVYGRANI